MQDGLLAVDDQRVARVVAALEAHHQVGAARQPVDDLALALVAPLGADQHRGRHRYLRRWTQAECRWCQARAAQFPAPTHGVLVEATGPLRPDSHE